MKILVTTDFSEVSDLALEAAIAQAGRDGGEIELLHVYEIPAWLAFDTVVAPSVEERVREQITDALADRMERVKARGVNVTTQQLDGRPWDEIARRAREGRFDLIVMGTHGRTGMRHALLGSVAERVIQRAPCPVLVVPPRGGAGAV